MVPVSDFFPRVIPYVPGCPEPFAAQAIIDAAIQFCEDTLCLRETLDAAVAPAGERFLDLDLPSGHQLARVLMVRRGDVVLTPLPFDNGQAMLGDESLGSPTDYYIARADETTRLGVFPLPQAATTLNVTAALKPLRKTTTLHSELFERHLDAVVDGALTRLHAVPDQPFTDAARSAAAALRFVFNTSRVRRESSFNRLRTSQSMRLVPFA